MGRIFNTGIQDALFGEIPNLTPAQRQKEQTRRNQALGSALSQFSAAFLQPSTTFVGAPSGIIRTPNVGSAFGQGLLGFQNSLQQSRQSNLRNQLVQSQIGVNQAKVTAGQTALQNAQNVQNILGGGNAQIAPAQNIPAIPGQPGTGVQAQPLASPRQPQGDIERHQTLLNQASRLDRLNTTESNQAADNLRAQARALADNSPAIIALTEGAKNRAKQIPEALLREPSVQAAGIRPGDTFDDLRTKLRPGARLQTEQERTAAQTRGRVSETLVPAPIARETGAPPLSSVGQERRRLAPPSPQQEQAAQAQGVTADPAGRVEAAQARGENVPITRLMTPAELQDSKERAKRRPLQGSAVISSIRGAQQDINLAKSLVFDKRGNLKTSVLTAKAFNLPRSEGRRAGKAFRRAVEIILRARTGAAAPDQEVTNYTDFYSPGLLDDTPTARDKMERLEQFFADTLTGMRANKNQPLGLPTDFRDLNSPVDPTTIRGGRITANTLGTFTDGQLITITPEMIDKMDARTLKEFKRRLGIE